MRLLFRNVNPEEQEDYAFLELEGGNLELIQRLAGEPFVKPAIKPPYARGSWSALEARLWLSALG